MKMYYRERGKVKIDMKDYLKMILDYPTKKYQGEAITPAVNHPFEMNNTARKLSKAEAKTFHTIMSNLLFLCNQARPDIRTGVVFITTQVREPNKEKKKNWGAS